MTLRRYSVGRFSLWTLLAGLFLAGAASADEPLPDVDDPQPAAAAPEKKPPSSLDGKVLRRLEPSSGELQSEIERMERAIAGMRRASERIEASDTTEATLELQQQVIDDLEKLLTLLKQQQKNRQQNPQSQDPNSQPQQRPQRMTPQQLDPRNSGKPSPSDADGSQSKPGRDQEKSGNSQERTDAARRREAEEARQQQIYKDVWGHLPPHLRAAMQTAFSEKYLPKYDDLVKRYYEALAEKNRRRSPTGSSVGQ
ncbi:MAG: hypothetical protein ACKV0T_12865 [Planctomycetales bacterium]